MYNNQSSNASITLALYNTCCIVCDTYIAVPKDHDAYIYIYMGVKLLVMMEQYYMSTCKDGLDLSGAPATVSNSLPLINGCASRSCMMHDDDMMMT